MPLWAGSIVAWLLLDKRKKLNWWLVLGSVACISAVSYTHLITADSEEKLIEQFADAVVKCLTGAVSFDISEMVRKAREESWECKQKESLNLYKTIVGL